jgi:hypothetical protein
MDNNTNKNCHIPIYKYQELSILSSILTIVGFIPDLLNENNYSNLKWSIWTASSFLSVLYFYENQDYYALSNRFIILIFNGIIFIKTVKNPFLQKK